MQTQTQVAETKGTMNLILGLDTRFPEPFKALELAYAENTVTGEPMALIIREGENMGYYGVTRFEVI